MVTQTTVTTVHSHHYGDGTVFLHRAGAQDEGVDLTYHQLEDVVSLWRSRFGELGQAIEQATGSSCVVEPEYDLSDDVVARLCANGNAWLYAEHNGRRHGSVVLCPHQWQDVVRTAQWSVGRLGEHASLHLVHRCPICEPGAPQTAAQVDPDDAPRPRLS
jgi:hypothetical protein